MSSISDSARSSRVIHALELIGEDPGGAAADSGVRALRVRRRSRPCPAPGCPVAARPRRPRARRSWTDRRAGATRGAADSACPSRPRHAAADARTSGSGCSSNGAIARANRARSGSGTSQRFSRSSSVWTSESVRGKRAGPSGRGWPIRAPVRRAAETPRPAPSRHNASRASECGNFRACVVWNQPPKSCCWASR